MATVFSKGDSVSLALALVKQSNDFQQASALAAGKFHRDLTSVPVSGSDYSVPNSSVLTVTAANSADLATSIALTNNLYAVLRAHFVDDSSHLVADSSRQSILDGYGVLPSNASLANVQTNLNAFKVVYNLHVASTTHHLVADAVNTTTSANATDQTTANTLANELKSDLNAHMASGPVGARIKIV